MSLPDKFGRFLQHLLGIQQLGVSKASSSPRVEDFTGAMSHHMFGDQRPSSTFPAHKKPSYLLPQEHNNSDCCGEITLFPFLGLTLGREYSALLFSFFFLKWVPFRSDPSTGILPRAPVSGLVMPRSGKESHALPGFFVSSSLGIRSLYSPTAFPSISFLILVLTSLSYH